MKKIFNYKLFLFAALAMSLNSCKMDVPNINQPSGSAVPTTREGIIAISAGLQMYYSTNGIAATYFYPAVTARELKGVATFTNTLELEAGGTELPTANGNILTLWSSMQKLLGMSESVLNNASSISTLTGGTLSGTLANAHLYRAIALGALGTSFEKANTQTQKDGKVTFVDRQAVLAEAIKSLNTAIALVQQTPISSEFTLTVTGSTINLLNCLHAFNARFNLMAGNYQQAYDEANLVDLTKKSTFTYTAISVNPLWNQTSILKYYVVRENLGLPTGLFETGDKRLDFYTKLNGTTLQLKGFSETQNGEVPVYLPDEMKLIKAEALLRNNGSLTEARDLINEVRTQTAGDLFNVNAGLPAYTGAVNKNDLLLEVYKQRCAELFMSGLRLEDSRRFDRPAPPQNTTERNRNFSPYPDQERIGNPNTPADPAI